MAASLVYPKVIAKNRDCNEEFVWVHHAVSLLGWQQSQFPHATPKNPRLHLQNCNFVYGHFVQGQRPERALAEARVPAMWPWPLCRRGVGAQPTNSPGIGPGPGFGSGSPTQPSTHPSRHPPPLFGCFPRDFTRGGAGRRPAFGDVPCDILNGNRFRIVNWIQSPPGWPDSAVWPCLPAWLDRFP